MDPYTTPALPPPAGQAFDPGNAQAPLRLGFIVSAAVCLGISSIFVLLRLYTKARIVKEFLLEDYAIVLAWLGTGAWYGLNFANSVNGEHEYEVSVVDYMTYLKYTNALLVLYCPIAFFAKLSILLQLQRIFTRSRTAMWWLCLVSIYINLSFYVALFFLSLFQCVPRERIFNPYMAEGSCISLAALLIPPSAVVVLSDIWILTVPVIVMWRLQMAVTRKIAIGGCFSVGLVSLVAAIMPLVYSMKFMRSDDETFAVYPIELWAGVQLTTLVLAAAIPTLPRLVAEIRGVDKRASFEKNSALKRIASFRRRRQRDTLDFRVPTPEIRDLASLGRPETPYEIFKTTEVRIVSYRIENPNAAIGQAV